MNIVKTALSIGLLASAVILAQGCATPSTAATSSTRMNDTRFGTVSAGMTSDEVRSAIGTPLRTMKFPGSGQEAWSYEGTDTWGYLVEYSVTFGQDQRVVSKFARRINDGGDMK